MKIIKFFSLALILLSINAYAAPSDMMSSIPGAENSSPTPDLESIMSAQPSSADFPDVEKEPPVTIRLLLPSSKFEQGKSYTLLLEMDIKHGFHTNSNKPKSDALIPTRAAFTTSDDKVTFGRISYPKAEMKKFQFSEDKLSVYEGVVYISTNVTITDTPDAPVLLKAELEYQACTDNICLMPITLEASVTVEAGSDGSPINQEIFKKFGSTSDDKSVMSGFETSTLPGMLLLVFLGGLALNLTPCVYPIIPVTIGFFGKAIGRSKAETTVHAFVYLLGMAAMYSVIGTFAALTGTLFGELMQNTVVILLLVAVMLLLSLSMFGVWDIRVPQSLLNLSSKNYSGFFGTFFMGLTVGIIAAPCVGPFVIALLTFVGEKQDPFLGFILFFVLAVGLGLPFVFLAIFSGALQTLPKSGVWMEWVRNIFGVILVGMALYFAQPLLPKSAIVPAASAIAILGGLYLFWSGRVIRQKGFRVARIIVSAAFMAGGVFLVLPNGGEKAVIPFKIFSDAAYDKAVADGKPTIVYFTADWCVPCRELKVFTFSDAGVIEKAARFTPLMIDLTTLEESEAKAKERFGIKGVPTFIIFDDKGIEQKRFTGFIPAEELVDYL
ncbi:MAG: thioredoxin fold domain-containing protein [Nitrospinota bacterium]|nr:thioredoxin fold domain-containing protein [Nitrospinota bacterium]